MLDMVLRNGLVVQPTGASNADIGIHGSSIAALGAALPPAPIDIDLAGKVIVPGGIDPHTHLARYSTRAGGQSADDYASGSRAAVAGGITTIINCVPHRPGSTLATCLDEEHGHAAGRSYVDYGYHMTISDLSVPDILDEVRLLPNLGITSVKVLTSIGPYRMDDADVLKVLNVAASAKLLVNAHVEDDALCEHLTARFLRAGQRHMRNLPLARPAIAEALAVTTLAGYARLLGSPIYFHYLSSREGVEAAKRARQAGTEAYVETRPVYLHLTDKVYDQPDGLANLYACIPPIRSQDDQAALWDAVRNGDVHTYATDHVAWTVAQKLDPDLSFATVPAGVPNLQTSLGMLFSRGVGKGLLSLEQFVSLTSANAAKLFGLWPRKGSIAVGSDADLTVIDPSLRFTVAAGQMESLSGYDPFDGWTEVGWPVTTILRGRVVYRDGGLVDARPGGKYMTREPYTRLD